MYVMVTCPNTGKSVSTGVPVDQGSVDETAAGGAAASGTFQCPECGEQHSYDARQVHLEERKRGI